MQAISRFLGLQLLALLLAIIASAMWVVGFGHGDLREVLLSTLMGGLCVWLPNLIFAARLALNTAQAKLKAKNGALSFNPLAFFVGEFIKLALTLGLLVAVAKWYTPVWPALIFGLIVTLKGYWLAFWYQR